MARVVFDEIYSLEPTKRRQRTLNSKDIPGVVKAKYREMGYDKKPKTQREVVTSNNDLNGLKTSMTDINFAKGKLTFGISPIRFFFGDAWKKVMKEKPEELSDADPLNILGVSLIVPVMYMGRPVLVGQIRANARGSGQVQVPLVAGGVEARSLTNKDPFISTLRREAKDEVGLNLSKIRLCTLKILTIEAELGACNLSFFAVNTKWEIICDSWVNSMKGKSANNIEASALVIIPLDELESVYEHGVEVVYIKKDGSGTYSVMKEIRIFRPLAKAIIDWLIANPEKKQRVANFCKW